MFLIRMSPTALDDRVVNQFRRLVVHFKGSATTVRQAKLILCLFLADNLYGTSSGLNAVSSGGSPFD
jgi:hypothetical protein